LGLGPELEEIMKSRHLITTVLMLAVGVGTGNPVIAGGGDVIGGLIVGGLLGAAIANDQNRRSHTTVRRSSSSRSSVSAAQREQNKEVQTALNYFGYPVGTPDGALGPKSRAAISQYQALLNFPATGQLAEMERQILVTAYNRALIGGPQVQQVVSSSPQGIRGMLLMQRNEMLGINGTPNYAAQPVGVVPPAAMATQPPMMTAPTPVAPLPPTTMVAQPQVPVVTMPAVPVAQPPAPSMPSIATAPAASAAAALPSFGAAMTPPKATMASYCAAVSAKSGANGRPQTVASMTDPAQALGEQFCAVSAAAKAEGDTLSAQIPGFTAAQIADQCKGFAGALKTQVSMISTTPRDDMVASIQNWIKQSGMPEDQLAATSKVCLGVGYGSDNAEMALASALVLTGTGNMVYAEMVGHHLTSGVGVDAHPEIALDWYDVAVNALSVGQTPVFLPEQSDRAQLIKKAALALNGRAEAVPMLPVPVLAPQAAPEAAAPTVSTKSASIGGLAGFAGAAASLVSTGAAMLPAKPATSAAP